MTTKYPAASEAATITVSVRTVHNRRGYMQYPDQGRLGLHLHPQQLTTQPERNRP